MLIPLILIVTIAIGGGMSVAADSSLPGDALYPVKIGVNESIASFLAVSHEAEARWAVRRAERRMEEAELLRLQNRLDAKTEAELKAAVAAQMNSAAEETRAVAASGDAATAADLNLRLVAPLRARAGALGLADAAITAAAGAAARAPGGEDTESDAAVRTRADIATRLGALAVHRDGQSIVLQGTLSRPTPCTEWETTGRITHGNPSMVVFSVTNKNKGVICTQVLASPQSVQARMEAEAAATIKIILEGETVFSGVLTEP